MSNLDHAHETTYRHVLETEGGGQIRYCAVHGRLQVIERRPGGRGQITTNIDDLDAAEHHGVRILEVVQIARAQRKQREGC